MNTNTLFIALALIIVIGTIYYFSKSNSSNRTSNPNTSSAMLYPKCCIEHDSLGNCTKYVWCSSANGISVVTSPNGTIFTHINEMPVPVKSTSAPAGAK